MRVSYNWLKTYVDFDATPQELATAITGRGLEVEQVLPLNQGVKGVVIGELLEVEKHPNADALLVTRVNVGAAAPLTICTGATNIAKGDRVPVAVPGSEIPGLKLSVRKMRGIASEGMLCSAIELGVGDDAEGILILAGDAPIGADAADYLGLNDTVLDLDLTANYAQHCQSMIGIAHEVAAIYGSQVRYPEVAVAAAGPCPIKVTIEAADLCPRYAGRVIKNVKLAPSPAWLQARLRAAGQRPINNVVDITNYVMLELGQPLHAFDAEQIGGGEIRVRTSRPAEALVTLDGKRRTLPENSLVIGDGEGAALGLAGVMGGLESEVTEQTTTVFLESALFDPYNNRATARQLGLYSEAVSRFSRGTDPSGVLLALDRAAQLLVELAGGELVGGQVDVVTQMVTPKIIPLRLSKVQQVLGLPLARTVVAEHLARLGLMVLPPEGNAFEVLKEVSPVPPGPQYQAWLEAAFATLTGAAGTIEELTGINPQTGPQTPAEEAAFADLLLVVVPTRRLDLALEIDLTEEVARAHGLDAIPARLPEGPLTRGGRGRAQELALGLRRRLAGLGLTEVMTHSLTHPRLAERLGLTEVPQIRVANPVYEERSVLRTTLLGSLLDTVSYNVNRRLEDVAIFELGRTYHPATELASEPLRLGLALMGDWQAPGWAGGGQAVDFFVLKGIIEEVLAYFGIAEWQVSPSSLPYLHPGRQAALLVAGEVVGHFGELHPEVANRWALEGRIYVAELAFAPLAERAVGVKRYQPISRHPAVGRDLALVLPKSVTAAEVQQVIEAAGGPLLVSAKLFDVFEGEAIGAERRSLAYHLTYQALDHTLTDEEVAAIQARIRQALEEQLGAVLRS